jgi:hypothetical protein
VTNNVKYTIPGETITDVYDLKGSSINRFMKLPKDGDKPVCKYCGNKFVFNSKTHIKKTRRSALSLHLSLSLSLYLSLSLSLSLSACLSLSLSLALSLSLCLSLSLSLALSVSVSRSLSVSLSVSLSLCLSLSLSVVSHGEIVIIFTIISLNFTLLEGQCELCHLQLMDQQKIIC